jgi:signal recognition particle receptor subunit beta
MVSINYAFREISCKVVFYGPGMSGKTTNLQFIHAKAPKDATGELISLATDADRTLYFDFLPLDLGAIRGFTTKFQLYTVPGQVYYNATRKLVLRGVDGIVFVADSQRDKMQENVESLKNLQDNLAEYGYELDQIPFVMQYNKRDLPNVATLEELEAALNKTGLPYFEAVATTGEGVFDTLKHIAKMVLDRARRRPEEAPIEARMEAAPTVPSPPVEAPVETQTILAEETAAPVPEPETAPVTEPESVAAEGYTPGHVPLQEEPVAPSVPPPPSRMQTRHEKQEGFSGEKLSPVPAPPPPRRDFKPVRPMAQAVRKSTEQDGEPSIKLPERKKSFFSRLFKSEQ